MKAKLLLFLFAISLGAIAQQKTERTGNYFPVRNNNSVAANVTLSISPARSPWPDALPDEIYVGYFGETVTIRANLDGLSCYNMAWYDIVKSELLPYTSSSISFPPFVNGVDNEYEIKAYGFYCYGNSGQTLGFAQISLIGFKPNPVKLISFKASAKPEGNAITWKTTSETNAAKFEIEKSLDAKEFKTIGIVNASGNSTETKSYSYTDTNPSLSTNYYRLKNIDLDGTFEYSNIISVNNDANNRISVSLFPNPSDSKQLSIRGVVENVKNISLVSAAGLVSQVSFEQTGSDITATLPSQIVAGNYFLKINSETLEKTIRLVVQ